MTLRTTWRISGEEIFLEFKARWEGERKQKEEKPSILIEPTQRSVSIFLGTCKREKRFA